jgi:hypothetical protein
LCVWAASASAATIAVRDEAQFQAAVSAFRDTGGRILLLPHGYRAPLVVGPRSSALLRIVGTRGARVQDLSLVDARSVGIAHVTFTPLGGDSRLIVARSRQVILDALTFTAAGTAAHGRPRARPLIPRHRATQLVLALRRRGAGMVALPAAAVGRPPADHRRPLP